MHELAVTENILSIALEKATTSSKIIKINLIIGELSAIVDECVEFYFGLLSKDTIAAESSLSFHRPPTRLRCRNCATTFSPVDIDWSCPNCREQKVEIVSGRECYIESIEVE